MFTSQLLFLSGESPNAEFQLWLWVGLALFAALILVGWQSASRKPNQAEGRKEAEQSASKKTHK